MTDFDRRTMLVGTGVLSATAVLPAIGAPRRSRPPNIVMIVSDQERSPYDLPSGFSRRHFDRLRARSLSFSRFHSPTAPCAPARAILYTGMQTQQNAVVANPGSGNSQDLDPAIGTLGTRLRSLGYKSFYKGKWHLSTIDAGRNGSTYKTSRDALEKYGFSDFNYSGDPTGYAWTGLREDGAIAADAAKLIGRLADVAEPWFVAINFVNPHDIMFLDATGQQHKSRAQTNLISPMLAPPPIPTFEKHWKFPLPGSFGRDDLSTKPNTQKIEREYLDLVYGHMPLDDIASWQRYQDYYLNCLTHLDESLGIVLNALDRHRLTDNTIIIYTSDHGERGGAHGLRQKGGDMYRENLCLPLLIAHPDGARGVDTESLGSTMDILPTLLEFADPANLAPTLETNIKGISLSPVVGNQSAITERDKKGVLFNFEVNMRWSIAQTRSRLTGNKFTGDATPDRVLMRGIHVGSYKFARYFRPGEHHLPLDLQSLRRHNDLELYDVKTDVHELYNLAELPDREQLIVDLNDRLNRLIKHEIGVDDGSVFRANSPQ
jgi:arylsulfatase